MVARKALIEWIPKEKGGRSKPPLGVGIPPYSTVVHFVDEPWPHTKESWSLVIVKDEPHSTELKWVADVHFLVEAAPHDALRDGREFELYEGGKCVARGGVLENSAPMRSIAPSELVPGDEAGATRGHK